MSSEAATAALPATEPPDPDRARRLPSVAELRRRWPRPSAGGPVDRTRQAIRDVLHGRDDRRVVVVVGPCSIHDPDRALEYGARLADHVRPLASQLVVVMRTYFEKPRTTVGWKGLVSDPHLDGSHDVATGLERARALLAALGDLGLACGAELLDPLVAPYLEDLLSWACIGARTSESQIHRQLASGLAMPVGFKNATDGDVRVAQDALVAAREAHAFVGVDDDGGLAVRRSAGNADGHVVLRGGGGVPNHDPESVAWAAARARRAGVARPVFVDCSHGNSQKDHRRQAGVCRSVLAQVRSGQRAVSGIMLESFLEPGAQPWRPGEALRPGVSITDACIGWNETQDLLSEIAEAVDAGGGRPPDGPASTDPPAG